MTNVLKTQHSRRSPPRLSDDAARHVRELIISGQLTAGEFIRPETIAVDLGISATPVREGMLQLQSEGFLKVRPRRGFVVSPLSPKDVSDAFDAQALLAGELCARAAKVLSLADFNTLDALQTKLEVAALEGDFSVEEELNFEFHRFIYHLADSPKIQWLLESTLRYAPRRFYSSIVGWPEATISEHRAILAALKSSDASTAREAMASHIQHAGVLLAEHLGAAVTT
ncbi:MAG: GntR family transcriptional regulator [Acidimicrobiales bacterium]|jgi:DNA-binding GntR family transcriptional regulator